MPKPGELLGGRYRLDDRIAAGGMGEVWAATDTVLSRPVAVKTLLGGRGTDPGFLRRFRHEARTMAALRHPGVVAVYDFGDTEDDSAYLVMARVDGEPLNRVIADRGQLTVAETMSIVAQAGRALQAAHEAGVIHRDVKPGNLIIEPDGTVVLVDFGVARSANSVTLTGAREVVGTALYIAPEQVSKRTTGPAADIYALGAVAYHCLTGRPPFLGDNPLAVALQHVTDEPPPLSRDVPRAVRDLVGIALAKQPEERFPSAAAMATAAEAAVAGSGATLTGITAATGALTATAGMTAAAGAAAAGAAAAGYGAAAGGYAAAANTGGLSGTGADSLSGAPTGGAAATPGGDQQSFGLTPRTAAATALSNPQLEATSAGSAGPEPTGGGSAGLAATSAGSAGPEPTGGGSAGPEATDSGSAGLDRNAATQKVAAGAFAARAMVGAPRLDQLPPVGPVQDGMTMADGNVLAVTAPPAPPAPEVTREPAKSRRALVAIAAVVLALLGLGAAFALADPFDLFGDDPAGGTAPGGVPSVAATKSTAPKDSSGKGSTGNDNPRRSATSSTPKARATSAAAGAEPTGGAPTPTAGEPTTTPAEEPTTTAPTQAPTGDSDTGNDDGDNSGSGENNGNSGSGGNSGNSGSGGSGGGVENSGEGSSGN
ncbi:protein kinase [Actinoplanes sp. NPDC020271]|uniref:serine/threonine-protein kinase n=1 Tax=Actinoplanes sp. NPDC020271 TaxID=3363896 RepID=UPI003797459C